MKIIWLDTKVNRLSEPGLNKKEVSAMQELVINKTFKTRAEMEAYEKELTEKYVIFMIMHVDQVIGEPEIYGIDKIIHFGLR